MTTTDETGSSLETAAGAAGPSAVEAFNLVSDETRLAILLALWEAYDRPDADDNAVSFSELYDEVDYDDRGNFRYHLEKLEGQFIRRRSRNDDYELRHTGLKLVQTVIGGAGVADTELEPAEVDRACDLCEAHTVVRYEDGIVFHLCTSCEGRMSVPEFPDGYLNSVAFHPAGVSGRSPEDLIAAAEAAAHRQLRTMFRGLCGTCSGAVDAHLELCTEHDTAGECERCGRQDPALAVFQCRVCKDSHAAPPSALCEFHPATVAFYYDHGLATRWHAEEVDGPAAPGEHGPDRELDLVSEDPPRVAITLSLDGDELRLTFDESAKIVDARRRARA